MFQNPLFNTDSLNNKTIKLEGINAVFTDTEDGMYDVLLEINSQRFLIKMWDRTKWHEWFEILAMKWFVSDLTNNFVKTLRNLTECLMFQLD